ncbi:MAG: hypothetical protein R3195_10975 [Gemmatimonadota bacterium]|nr:hypothetical protein [Gemmatimonadota bacterium]
MLIRRADLDGIAEGRIDLAFRRMRRPTVKSGGTLTTVVGVLAVEAVDRVEPEEVSEEDARRAGFESRATLLDMLSGREGDLYRIRLRWAGEDPRVQLRERGDLSNSDREEIRRRLARCDGSSRHGPWTERTLSLIGERPATLAATLAAEEGWETAWFKRNVRKLKALGLTESLEVGYRLSPRGNAFLERREGG